MPSILSHITLEQSHLNSVDREKSAVYTFLHNLKQPRSSFLREREVPSTLFYMTLEQSHSNSLHRERSAVYAVSHH